MAAFALTATIASAANTLTVRYYNEAGIPGKALASAVGTANLAMRTAGIQVHWLDCYATPEDCREAGDRALAVTFTVARPSEAGGGSLVNAGFSMGYSLLPENGAGGVYAKVMWNRVIAYAQAVDAPAAAVLGHVIAHELGHLLLNTGRHSHHGIMKAVWTGSGKSLLAGGRLAFQGHEAAAMRRRVAAAAGPR
jgi:hypothetical protein